MENYNNKQIREKNNIKNFIKRHINTKYKQNENNLCRVTLNKYIQILNNNPSDNKILDLLKITLKDKLNKYYSIIAKTIKKYKIINPDNEILGYSKYQESLESIRSNIFDMSDMYIIYNDWKYITKLKNILQKNISEYRCFIPIQK